jgi:Sec-independent protein translocase protein TatA
MAMNERWKKLVPVKIRSQRQSIANVQVMGLFGLGGLEVAVICVGIGIVLGPQTIGNLIRSTGKTASEYKTELSKVPDEFQKGYEEGQIDARSRKAKQMVLPDEKEAKDGSNTY